jgi:tetratricopeptide (TPR) repeat protein
MAKFEDATRACKRAQSLHPRAAIYHEESGLVYIDAGQREDATKEFELAVEKDPQLWESRVWLAKLLIGLRQMNAALQQLERALKVAGPKAMIFKYQGIAFEGLGKRAEAISAFEKTIKLDAKDAEAWFLLGVAYETSNQFGKAMHAYQTVEKLPVKEKATALLVYFKLGQTAEYMGQKANACISYKRFIEQATDNDPSRKDAADAVQRLGCK